MTKMYYNAKMAGDIPLPCTIATLVALRQSMTPGFPKAMGCYRRNKSASGKLGLICDAMVNWQMRLTELSLRWCKGGYTRGKVFSEHCANGDDWHNSKLVPWRPPSATSENGNQNHICQGELRISQSKQSSDTAGRPGKSKWRHKISVKGSNTLRLYHNQCTYGQ